MEKLVACLVLSCRRALNSGEGYANLKVKVFYDEDVRQISMRDAITAIEDVFRKIKSGEFLSPPRTYIENGNGSLVFTIGGSVHTGVMGFRLYDTFSSEAGENQQLVAVYDSVTGRLKAVVIGNDLGAVRTGTIGGVAVKHLSKEDSKILGVIGSGQHARTQLTAACAVRNIEQVKVFSRNPEKHQQFAGELSKLLKIEIEAVRSAEDAVQNADIVLCATTSSEPVLHLSWLKGDVHINSIGPKFKSRHELPAELGDSVDEIYTDSLVQMSAYPEEHFLSKSEAFGRIRDLSEVVDLPRRRPKGKSLFLSVGLSETEAAVADLLLK
jgi:alanine dehydrogenase